MGTEGMLGMDWANLVSKFLPEADEEDGTENGGDFHHGETIGTLAPSSYYLCGKGYDIGGRKYFFGKKLHYDLSTEGFRGRHAYSAS